MQSYYFALPAWVAAVAVLSIVILLLPWKVQPVSAAVLVYSWQDSPIPILLSPFLIPHWKAAISRIVHLAWAATHTHSSRLSLLYFAKIYPALLAARAGSGFLLSRSVGWKYPHLFSHSALYEQVVGFGPLLLGSLLFDETHDQQSLLIRYAVIFAFALLDAMPWTYTCAAAIMGLHRLWQAFFAEGKYTVLPWHTPDPQDAPNGPPLSRTRIFVLSIGAMLISGSTGVLTAVFTRFIPSPPVAPYDIHIVMLTVPRPLDPPSNIMVESIQSYMEPWHANLNSSFTVFAHLGEDGKHSGFDRARAFFRTTASQSTVPITFYVEPPHTPGQPALNHHMHLADAMRYAYSVGYEWTMFVEDDFVLCEQWGWEGLMRVMERLSQRNSSNGAFIGTGGRYVVEPSVIMHILISLPAGLSFTVPCYRRWGKS